MKKVLVVLSVVVLAGCSSLKDWIPVRWDANQSQAITSIQQTTRNFDCKGDIAQQSKDLSSKIQWFTIYSESKPTRDVIGPIGHMNDTVKELVDRSSKGPVSPVYCEIKKKLMIQQADMVAHTVQGRF
jgi:outer membrane biogenesis lipoprotein LolB